MKEPAQLVACDTADECRNPDCGARLLHDPSRCGPGARRWCHYAHCLVHCKPVDAPQLVRCDTAGQAGYCGECDHGRDHEIIPFKCHTKPGRWFSCPLTNTVVHCVPIPEPAKPHGIAGKGTIGQFLAWLASHTEEQFQEMMHAGEEPVIEIVHVARQIHDTRAPFSSLYGVPVFELSVAEMEAQAEADMAEVHRRFHAEPPGWKADKVAPAVLEASVRAIIIEEEQGQPGRGSMALNLVADRATPRIMDLIGDALRVQEDAKAEGVPDQDYWDDVRDIILGALDDHDVLYSLDLANRLATRIVKLPRL